MTRQPPRVRVALDDEIPVKYGTFALQVERPANPDESPFEIDLAGGIVGACTGGVVFGSAASEHYPFVRIELWTAAPPDGQAHGEDWDAVGEARLNSPEQAVLRLRSDFGDWTPGLLELFEPGPYHVRAHVSGRADAAARLRETRYFHGVERWLVRIWREPR
jgi:hypothetical protein